VSNDIWSSVGVGIEHDEGGWLYRLKGEVRGPVAYENILNKFVTGELPLTTEVAKEGSAFHSITQVAAFAAHVEEAKAAITRKSQKKAKRLFLTSILAAIVVVITVSAFMWHRYQKLVEKRLAAEARELAIQKSLPKPPVPKRLELVALVSLGSEKDIKIRKNQEKREGLHRPGAGRPKQPRPTEESFSECELSQQDIFATLRGNLAKINVCVQDEKQRDPNNQLPNVLQLDFVVRTDGRVVDFQLLDRHYRTGPMNNCMVKAFNAIKFPTSKGANCPITLPIKIGG